MKTTVHQKHNKKSQCIQCKRFFLPQESGSVKVIVSKIIDENTIIKELFCSLPCADKYIEDEMNKIEKKCRERCK